MSFILEQDDSNTSPGPGSLLYHEGTTCGKVSSFSTQLLTLLTSVTASMPPREAVRLLSAPAPGTTGWEATLTKLFGTKQLLALDLETRGLSPLNPENDIVGLGLANATTIAYLDFKSISRPEREDIYAWLANSGHEFVGHNVMFDGTWLAAQMRGHWLPWSYDTYALYRQLATEGYLGQRYGLKDAQISLLQWPTKGDVELEEWLVLNGYYKGATRADTTPEGLKAAWDGGSLKASKGDMHHAPAPILGYYCGLDVASTYQLLTEVFLPSLARRAYGARVREYHALFLVNLRVLVEQRLFGIKLDAIRLETYQQLLEHKVQEAQQAVLTEPAIAAGLQAYKAQQRVQLQQQEPPRWCRVAPLGKEPARFKKGGKESMNWVKWDVRRQKMANGELQRETVRWQTWQERMLRDPVVNIDAGTVRQWLFYDWLKYPVVLHTEKGSPAVDKKALRGWGQHGQLLKSYNDVNKEKQMFGSCLATAVVHAPGEVRIHPEFKAPGTFTCRLSGAGGFNIQQLPKRKEYLQCWVPDEGKIFVDCDHAALEPVVLAALSGDSTLLKLYGPDARPNDVYLFNGSAIPGLRETIRAAGYDPDLPTKEAISNAKKVCKKERTVSKIITLGSQYGMGPKKLRVTLALEGIDVTDDEAYQMYRGYWELYAGVKKYGQRLQWEWQRNNGWVMNGINRPVCCAEDFLKDITNRVVQSTGHDIHMLFVEAMQELREEWQLPFEWIISDFHDQSIVQVPVGMAEKMVALYRAAYVRTNQRLKRWNPSFLLEIKGEPAIVPTLAEAKIQE